MPRPASSSVELAAQAGWPQTSIRIGTCGAAAAVPCASRLVLAALVAMSLWLLVRARPRQAALFRLSVVSVQQPHPVALWISYLQMVLAVVRLLCLPVLRSPTMPASSMCPLVRRWPAPLVR